MISPLADRQAEAVLERLHALDARQFRSVVARYLPRAVLSLVTGKTGLDPTSPAEATFLRDKLVALDSTKADLCYVLCRAIKARRVVEFATSFGVSTIYLAAAVRDNVMDGGGAGVVIGTENEPSKVIAAPANLAAAGLAEFTEIREGDALETLKDAGGPVDFLLVDSWIPLARLVLELMGPQLRLGALVVCDNVAQYQRAYRDYLDYIRNPVNGFRSVMLTDKGGFELSVRVT